MIALLKKLPFDAIIVRMFDDTYQGCSGYIVWSSEFDHINEGLHLPDHTIVLTRDDEIDARLEPGEKIVPPISQFIQPLNLPVDERFQKMMKEVKDKLLNACACDLAYTGAKTHSPNCPMKKS